MQYNHTNSSVARSVSPAQRPTISWRLLGRTKTEFAKQMKPYANCPANIFYWASDPFAQRFANDLMEVLAEAGWNVSLGAEEKKTVGVRVVTKSPALHEDEIKNFVVSLRAAGFDAKVRVRHELGTEAVQIFVGEIPSGVHGAGE